MTGRAMVDIPAGVKAYDESGMFSGFTAGVGMVMLKTGEHVFAYSVFSQMIPKESKLALRKEQSGDCYAIIAVDIGKSE